MIPPDANHEETTADFPKIMEERLLQAKWKRNDNNEFLYQKSPLFFEVSYRKKGQQPAIRLTISAQKLNDAEPQRLILSIDCRNDKGCEYVLKEIITLQKGMTLENYKKYLQRLVYVHSDEMAVWTDENEWYVLNAADTLAFPDDLIQTDEVRSALGDWYSSAQAHKVAGRYAEAAHAFQKAAELAPALAEAWHNMGFSLRALGQVERAAQILVKAGGEYSQRLEHYPFNAYNQFWLACVYSLLKDKVQTLENLAYALELNPQFRDEARVEEDLMWLWWDRDFLRLVDR